jgi:hypothetical protein
MRRDPSECASSILLSMETILPIRDGFGSTRTLSIPGESSQPEFDFVNNRQRMDCMPLPTTGNSTERGSDNPTEVSVPPCAFSYSIESCV